MNERTISLGFTQQLLAEAAAYPNLFLGRITAQSTGLYRVSLPESDLTAEVSGKFRHRARAALDFPLVGDFALVDRAADQYGHGLIQELLPRRSVFVRKAAGRTREPQGIAANITTVFVCMALTGDFNLRRLERYLAAVWDSGAAPVVVLTKADLAADVDEKLASVKKTALGAGVLVTSAVTAGGFQAVLEYCRAGETIAFLGSSGVGKSSLINCLLGEERAAVGSVRSDDRGRHTTTKRELLLLPCQAAVIDTPGLRELGLDSADLEQTFADIEDLAGGCRFRNCSHGSEPDCVVQQAIAAGEISIQRLRSYEKLQKEAQYQGLDAKRREKKKMDSMFADIGGVKNARQFLKSKKRER